MGEPAYGGGARSVEPHFIAENSFGIGEESSLCQWQLVEADTADALQRELEPEPSVLVR